MRRTWRLGRLRPLGDPGRLRRFTVAALPPIWHLVRSISLGPRRLGHRAGRATGPSSLRRFTPAG